MAIAGSEIMERRNLNRCHGEQLILRDDIVRGVARLPSDKRAGVALISRRLRKSHRAITRSPGSYDDATTHPVRQFFP
jgi:hypothetical protein